ncbi:hypothetical protein COT48_04840 [Candidatus Woesearchaeota archaeon CG08_land_8_20_14_0_20_47_9]|nr:MAG: hypothetical protein AUJ69_01800 [Candidatus Woesearchaeota archaeon CG1_02_47_18]PIO03428.1 MAG: hypothetical protein COT48_04840 [Candidatus Woesearchaeota archaeon CG08_land_8_20_14_0_20_47_9]
MLIIFTKHAEQRLKVRKIPKDDVLDTQKLVGSSRLRAKLLSPKICMSKRGAYQRLEISCQR